MCVCLMYSVCLVQLLGGLIDVHGVENIVSMSKVETPIHEIIRELVTWECKEHGVKS